MNHKISIIIPSFNQGKFIERAFKSLEAQNDANLEIIVMDGGSTDNSVDVIKKYEHIITYWQSQKDNGQSAAINDGIKRTTGDFVTWFNTDDLLVPDAIANLRKCITAHPGCRWFCGSTLWIDVNDRITHIGRQERMGRLLDSTYFISAGPSAFMHRDLLTELGLLREDLHYIMDLELWYRFTAVRVFMQRIPGYTWAIRVHKDSKTMGRFAENDEAYQKHAQKLQAERDLLITMYPNRTLYQAGKILKLSYYLNKLFDCSVFSHILDRKMLGTKVWG